MKNLKTLILSAFVAATLVATPSFGWAQSAAQTPVSEKSEREVFKVTPACVKYSIGDLLGHDVAVSEDEAHIFSAEIEGNIDDKSVKRSIRVSLAEEDSDVLNIASIAYHYNGASTTLTYDSEGGSSVFETVKFDAPEGKRAHDTQKDVTNFDIWLRSCMFAI